MPGSDATLQATMAGLETGLRVRHITTYELDTCDPDSDIRAVLADPQKADYDCIPVRSNGVIVRYVWRSEGGDGKVSEHMKPISEAMLVSADLPLTSFVPVIGHTSHRLVLDGMSIRGIVTWSDLQKPPVRLYVFALVNHLEQLMAEVITAHCPSNDAWLAHLSNAHKAAVRKFFNRFRAERLDPPMLEFTTFVQKSLIIASLLNLSHQQLGEFDEIRTGLRNVVSHAGTYAGSGAAVKDFARRLQLAQDWIARLPGFLPNVSTRGNERAVE